MTIETKYDVGDRVWIVYENSGEISVFDDTICSVTFENDIFYYTTKEGFVDKKEDEIILFEDNEGLVDRIRKLMSEIRNREDKEKEKEE